MIQNSKCFINLELIRLLSHTDISHMVNEELDQKANSVIMCHNANVKLMYGNEMRDWLNGAIGIHKADTNYFGTTFVIIWSHFFLRHYNTVSKIGWFISSHVGKQRWKQEKIQWSTLIPTVIAIIKLSLVAQHSI